jgi:Uma2 family endonuclease
MLAYKPIYTYEDYKKWKGDWELIDGNAIAMAPSPFGPHQNLLVSIASDIRNSLRNCKNGCFVYAELDYIVDEINVLRPDISLVCEKVKDFIKIAPKLIVEILSPSTSIKDEKVKFEIYEKEGVEFYMIVDYKLKKVRLFKLVNSKYQKIDEKVNGIMKIKINGCEISFNIDEWWEMI